MYVYVRKERVLEIINQSENIGEAIVALHKELFADWDKIESLNQFVSTSRETNHGILDWLIAKDKTSAMAWVNWGFSSEENIPNWHFKIDPSKIIYREESQ